MPSFQLPLVFQFHLLKVGLQTAPPPARMTAAVKDADHNGSVVVSEVEDPKGKSVQ
jgi:hypothetical protein